MQLIRAERKKAKIKLGLQGPSGSGKTFSALLLAYGLVEDWSKIAIIDTENHSANLYAHLGGFNVLHLEAPFTPEKYIKAIRLCVTAGMEVLIIDSISHEWEGTGGILDTHSQMTGNSFTAWAKLTPRHNAFIQEILQSPVHILATTRTKQDYVLVDKNGKMVPEKVGLKGITRDGMDYEFTLVFDLDCKNNSTASKDRTGLFFGQPEQKISTQTGAKIKEWCNSGADINVDDISQRIGECHSLHELLDLYKEYPQFKAILQPEFELRKRQIIINQEVKSQLIHPSISENGTSNE